MKVSIDEGAFIPVKAHAEDGGFDLKSPIDTFVPAKGSSVVDTGVHMEIKRGYAGLLVSKSGLNIRKGITSTGLIDSGYTGSIKVKLYNNGFEEHFVRRGDKISQIVIIPISDDNGIEVVDVLDTVSERGNNGFGSTGR